MLIDFNREVKLNSQDTIPKLITQGIFDEVISEGNLGLVPDHESMTIEGLRLKNPKEYEDKLGSDPSIEDILKYSYNSQKEICFSPIHEGYIKINGQDKPIEEMNFNLLQLYTVEYVQGDIIAIPHSFPETDDIMIGGKGYSRSLKTHRVPNESLNKIEIQSDLEEPLRVELILDDNEKTTTINISIELKFAKTIKDIVESIFIYDAFANNEGIIDGEKAVTLFQPTETSDVKKFNQKMASFWKKTLEIENILNNNLGVRFVPPKGSVDDETISSVEELYQSLVLNKPVRINNSIESVKGNLSVELDLNALVGNPIFTIFDAKKSFDIFDTQFELYSLNGILDAVVSNYKTDGDQLILYFEHEDIDNESFLATIDFLSEKELKKYREENGKSLENTFRNCSSINELFISGFNE